MEFPKMLRLFRESLELSLQEVATAVSQASGIPCTRQAVSLWEHGQNTPSQDDVSAIVDLFNVRMRTVLVAPAPTPRKSRVRSPRSGKPSAGARA